MRRNLVRLICGCVVAALLLVAAVPRAEAQGVGYDGTAAIILLLAPLAIPILISYIFHDVAPAATSSAGSESLSNPAYPPGL